MPVDQIPGTLEKFVNAPWRWWVGLGIFGLTLLLVGAESIKEMTVLQQCVFGVIAFAASMIVPNIIAFGYERWHEREAKQEKIAEEERAADRAKQRAKEAAKEADLANRATLFRKIDQCNEEERNLIHRAFLNGGSTIVRTQHGFTTEESRASRSLVQKGLFTMGDGLAEGEMIILRDEFMAVLHARYGEDSEDKAQLRKDVEVWNEKLHNTVVAELKRRVAYTQQLEADEAARHDALAARKAAEEDELLRKALWRCTVSEAMLLKDAYRHGGTITVNAAFSPPDEVQAARALMAKTLLTQVQANVNGTLLKVPTAIMDFLEREHIGVEGDEVFKAMCAAQSKPRKK